MNHFKRTTGLSITLGMALTAGSSWAQPFDERTATQPPATQPPEASREINDESLPMYGAFRVSSAVPIDGEDDILALGVGVGLTFEPSETSKLGANNVGLRLIWIPDAPANPLEDDAPEVGAAWGGVIDWQHEFSPRKRLSIYTNVGVGFVYARPTDAAQAEAIAGGTEPEDAKKNQVIPILEGGLGLRILSSKLNGAGLRAFVSPELGFVPGVNAPYAALTVGIR